ncbi:DnaA regulatory inactivator Hda [Chitinimonas koreensis]|uniref:DnaA regulatory inactivator Hda n=1 Tax=Chitinimonas koreensis TaxID=356302 RepID=UPI00040B6D57|nr:DnaA regulatory inactivator Hda [Chitinimonas koreensis]QNM96284.1 DnaA regulatory inactivator Hda [Chitinimonas koreensis]
MKQLPLDLQLPEPFGFDDFLIGPNLEAFLALKALADGVPGEGCVYLWGAHGTGKSHLLRATVLRALAGGLYARYWDAAETPLDELAHGYELLAVDHVDGLDDAGQVALFGLINAQREAGRVIVTAGSRPPAQLALREDLTTRLGWGLVFEIGEPADEDKATLLRHRARARGCEVDEAVCRWLVTHQSRDLGDLTRLLDRLDRAALAAGRPLTLPLVRETLRSGPGE